MNEVKSPLLRQAREKRGWSRGFVAEHVEVDVATVGRWERGERVPHPVHRQRLCLLFDMDAEALGLFVAPVQEERVPADESSGSETLYQFTPTTPPVASLDAEEEAPIETAVSEHALDGEEKKAAVVVKTPVVPARPTRFRRRELFIGLGSLGGLVLLSGGFVATQHMLTAANPKMATAVPTALPSQRLAHLIDPGTTNWINSIALSPDANTLAVANGVNKLSLWNVQNGALANFYTTANQWINDISWSPQRLLASASADHVHGSIQVWHAQDKQPRFTYTAYPMRTVNWSPDGKYLVWGGHVTTVEVWDMVAHKRVTLYEGHRAAGINRVKWSPDGTLIASCDDSGVIQIWHALTGKGIATYRGHKAKVYDLAWSPQGNLLASASFDKTVHVWHARDASLLTRYTRHTDAVHCVAWSPDGTCIVSGGGDAIAYIWHAATGQSVYAYRERTSTIQTIIWTPDGSKIMLGSQQQGIEIWQAPTKTA